MEYKKPLYLFIFLIFCCFYASADDITLFETTETENSCTLKIEAAKTPFFIQKPDASSNTIFLWSFSNLDLSRKIRFLEGTKGFLNYAKIVRKNSRLYCLILTTSKKATVSEKMILTRNGTYSALFKFTEEKIPEPALKPAIPVLASKFDSKDEKKKIQYELKNILGESEKESPETLDIRNTSETDNSAPYELVFLNRNHQEKTTHKTTEKIYTIVIDPGHGGKDPGALSASGLKEKDITLDIALKLKKILASSDSVKVVMTREKDIYIPLVRRREIACDVAADIFVSIHADSSEIPSARGGSVFVLSRDGSSDHISGLLAASHDKIEKYFGEELKTSDSTVMSILMDLKTNYNTNESTKLANYMLEYMCNLLAIRSRGVNSAPFSVLKLISIPCVLVETAFLSNKEDAKLLSSEQFRMKMAYALYNGIMKYCRNNNSDNPEPVLYTIKKGDNLWKIAKEYSTDIRSIVEINKINGDILVPGSKIIIPY